MHAETYKLKIGRTRVRDIMAEKSMIPKTIWKFKATAYSNHDYPVAPDLLDRNFQVERANMAWVSDITYISMREGWLISGCRNGLIFRKNCRLGDG